MYCGSSRQLARKPVNQEIRPTTFFSSLSLQLKWLLAHSCSQAAIRSTVSRSVRTQLSRWPCRPREARPRFVIMFGCSTRADCGPHGKGNMPTDVVMPQMGESIFEGTITKWLKKTGDKVQRDEPLFEISTEKVDAEILAPASGVLQEIKVAEGNTVQVNTIVGTISADGESSTPAKSAPAA